jgi:hypothetical protein
MAAEITPTVACPTMHYARGRCGKMRRGYIAILIMSQTKWAVGLVMKLAYTNLTRAITATAFSLN